MDTLNCPACTSEQTQRLSAIVDGGTSHTRGTSVGGFSGVGAGFGGGVGGFGGMSRSVHNSTTKSALANKLAAPVRRPEKRLYVFGALLILISFSVFSTSVLIALLMIAGGGFLIYRGTQNGAFNRKELPQLYASWSNTFYCHRCQHVYLPAGFAYARGGPVIDAGGAPGSIPGGNASSRLN